MHSNKHSLTHSHTYFLLLILSLILSLSGSLARSLARSLTYCFIRSFSHLRGLIHPLSDSFSHSLFQQLTLFRPFTHSFICLLAASHPRPLVRSLFHPCPHAFLDSRAGSVAHSSTHELPPSLTPSPAHALTPRFF